MKYLLFILASLFLCVKSYISLKQPHYISTNRHSRLRPLRGMVDLPIGADFESAVIKDSEDMPVLVDFMANWCGPCKLVGPIFKSLADDFTGKVKFVKVDTDIHEESVDRYNIQGLPLFAIFVKGKVVATHSGALTRENLRNFINKHTQVSQ